MTNPRESATAATSPQGDGAPVTVSLDDPSQLCAVTPAMREAGADVLQELFGVISSEGLAERVYTAMDALRTRAS